MREKNVPIGFGTWNVSGNFSRISFSAVRAVD